MTCGLLLALSLDPSQDNRSLFDERIGMKLELAIIRFSEISFRVSCISSPGAAVLTLTRQALVASEGIQASKLLESRARNDESEPNIDN